MSDMHLPAEIPFSEDAGKLEQFHEALKSGKYNLYETKQGTLVLRQKEGFVWTKPVRYVQEKLFLKEATYDTYLRLIESVVNMYQKTMGGKSVQDLQSAAVWMMKTLTNYKPDRCTDSQEQTTEQVRKSIQTLLEKKDQLIMKEGRQCMVSLNDSSNNKLETFTKTLPDLAEQAKGASYDTYLGLIKLVADECVKVMDQLSIQELQSAAVWMMKTLTNYKPDRCTDSQEQTTEQVRKSIQTLLEKKDEKEEPIMQKIQLCTESLTRSPATFMQTLVDTLPTLDRKPKGVDESPKLTRARKELYAQALNAMEGAITDSVVELKDIPSLPPVATEGLLGRYTIQSTDNQILVNKWQRIIPDPGFKAVENTLGRTAENWKNFGMELLQPQNMPFKGSKEAMTIMTAMLCEALYTQAHTACPDASEETLQKVVGQVLARLTNEIMFRGIFDRDLAEVWRTEDSLRMTVLDSAPPTPYKFEFIRDAENRPLCRVTAMSNYKIKDTRDDTVTKKFQLTERLTVSSEGATVTLTFTPKDLK